MRLTAVGPAAREAWTRVLPLDPTALVSQTPSWLDCVCASGRYEDVTRAYTTNDGHQLVLPMVRLRLGRMTLASSMPFGWGTGGLISSRGHTSEEDVTGVIADLTRQRVLRIAVRPSPLTAGAWATKVPSDVIRTEHMTQSVDLGDGFDVVWKRMASTVRSHVRKAERRGVTVEHDDTGRLMPVFDRLYRKSVERWAHQQHEPMWLARWRAERRDPPEKFRTVAERLRGDCRVWVASRNGEAIAAMIVLAHGEHSTMWRAAMDKEAIKGTGAGELVHARAFAEACEEGRRFFHLGDSAPGSALARNKRGFGAGETHYTGYRFERVPLTATDQFLRRQIKRTIKFRD